VNVLLITLDQFRADCLSVAGHPLVRTPALDELAGEGVRLARHYSQAAPCAPGRASLYTGMYQMNHRVVANGTPLDARFDNVAKAARRAGYDPVLFGYTDQSIDPRESTGPDDPRMQNYTGVLPGFRPLLHIPDDHQVWLDWLAARGYTDFDGAGGGGGYDALGTEPLRPAELSVSTFLTDHAIDWLRDQRDQRNGQPWFAHLSYLRPHPPYAAAGEFAHMYDPDDVSLPVEATDDRLPFHDALLSSERAAAPSDEASIRRIRAQYYGMISEVDAQLARLWATLRELDMWDDTVVIVTADHGEQLGDHGLLGKLAWFEESYHILGIVRHPLHPQAHGTVVDSFTENVDLFPTICDVLGIEVPVQCDGLPLTPFLRGEQPPWWRNDAHWEFDWRDQYLLDEHPWPWDQRLERQQLACIRDADGAYVQFGNGTWRCFDLAADPTWRTLVTDPARVLPYAQAMVSWRALHTDRTHTGMLVVAGGLGRFPERPMIVETPMP
jgi:arylsulfatase A-like enzyme